MNSNYNSIIFSTLTGLQKESSIMDLSNYEIIEEIGQGMFSIVYKVREKLSGEFYAMKKIEYDRLKPKEKDYAKAEIRILKKISHPNIIKFKDSFFENSFLYIVMELAQEGDLQKRISEYSDTGKRFSTSTILNYAYQLTQGLQALHSNQIIHRDIKPANIFLMGNDLIKIGDFNVGKFNSENLLHTKVGTPLIMSPELFNGKQYDLKTDIWSLGCVIYEMATLHTLIEAESEAALYVKIHKIKVSIQGERDLEAFVRSLVKFRPEKRPTCIEILALKIFEKFNKMSPSKSEMSRRENKSKTTIRVPSLVNISLTRDLSIRKLHKSPSSAKGRYLSENGNHSPHGEILKANFKVPECKPFKIDPSPEISPELRSHRNSKLPREFSLRLNDISDTGNDLYRQPSYKNISTPKGGMTPKIISKNFPISFGSKIGQLSKDNKNNYLRLITEKKSSRIINAPRMRQAAGVYLNGIHTIKSKSICRKRSQQVLTSFVTAKPLNKAPSLAKVFSQMTSK